MKKFLAIIFLLLSIQVGAQQRFRIEEASKKVDVAFEVGACSMGNHGRCGPVKVEFFRKKSTRPFQSIRLAHTELWDGEPTANVTRRYDEQSTINFGDFNFDGQEDLAICDGTNGGYGMPSYRIYLFTPAKKRFVYSRTFTRMNDGGLGMFETDQKKRMHLVFTKSGCCWHQTQGFDVFRGKPRKVYEFTEAVLPNGEVVEITTRKLINGRWRTWIKHAKVSEYYK